MNSCRTFLTVLSLILFPLHFSAASTAEALCAAGPCSKPVKLAFLQNKACGTDDNPAKLGKRCSAHGICNGINSDCCAKNDKDCLAGKR
jgi:hypothetical protein